MGKREGPIRFRAFVIRRGVLIAVVGLVVLVIVALVGTNAWDKVDRRINGVRNGVTLEGERLGGLLPDELYQQLLELSYRLGDEALDARMDPVTGEIKPESLGRVLDVEATMQRVLAAAPRQEVEGVYITVLPTVTKEHFQPIRQGSPELALITLTINVAWGEEFLPSMLETLAKEEVQATFFFVGDWVEKFPDLTRQIASAGHEIANHGYRHYHPNTLNKQQIKDMILQNEALLEQVTGQVTRLFAPPYGEYNELVVATAAELGYRTILWTLDTIDWQRPPVNTILQRTVGRATNGAIILMHPTQPTAQALPAMIKGFKEKGYRLVPISELLGESGI